MSSYQKNARITGALFITAAVAGIMSVVLSKPVLDDPEYLLKIAENGSRVITGALLEAIMAFACAGIAIWLYPVLRKHNEAIALGSVGFRIIEAVFFVVAAICLLSLLTVGREYVKAGAPDAPHYQDVGALLLAVRYWASQVFAALAFVLGALLYYSIFYQSRIIPRWLSGWGIIAITLHLAAVLLTLFALITPFSKIQVMLALPVFLQEMVLAVWLIVKGFDPSRQHEPIS
ncbi:MAG TPA: DUF4386 domain-containing protein [Nitrospirota bacterium]|nr:DUF4386 domain-containing protein [Nitrospirota bacterium]